ncbi:serine/threonine protein kinase [Streptosporangium becharense]|uniref:non-specific serine/threonine protein kinase n=1 Tax=Streptosporangium becharense TaxID=1816182 RepID=A0A7W9IEE9_9ACTN|nr:serine/threonine-protein kinase [Streptosporangium becharense]MBB2909850.1 serine/threonine protein kinase [Streptosporangium becharense]MBB5819195.1 serine/threonine protein kinase [Streptosporangium becharense]
MSGIETRVLAGRYRLLDPLGEGGSGTVWRAADEMLGRDVAIKEIRFPPDLDPARRQEVTTTALREAHLAARLKHPSIVTVHDVVIEQDRPWIVMELLSGASLDRTVRDRSPLPARQVARVGAGILSALITAHAAGVIHRDVKPGNVFLTRTGKAVLTDFGIAVVDGEATVDRTGRLVGSPNYIAPERLRGERGGPVSDLWSLGATLYFAVEGVPPHPAATPVAAIGRVLTEPPRPPERAGPLAPLLMLMLDPAPEARPSFDAVAHALGELTAGRAAGSVTPGSATTGPVASHTASPVSTGSASPGPASAGSVPMGSAGSAELSSTARFPSEHPRPVPANPAPNSRRTLLWITAEVAGVAVVAGATLGAVLLLRGEPVRERPVAFSERPGAFATPVDLCGLFPASRAKQLLPTLAGEGKPTNDGGCRWEATGMGVEVRLSNAKQWGKSPRQAHELFVNRRNSTIPSGQNAWSWSDIQAGVRSARSTGPLAVKSTGDEAFGYDVYENRKTGRLEQSYVVMRVDNLVLDIGYTVVDGSKDGPAIRKGAHTVATWVANALNKQKAGG